MGYKVIAGLPSLNEESTISGVVKGIDDALSAMGSDFDAIIVNADNGSSDSTVEKFNGTETKFTKKHFTTSQQYGKGANLKKILEFAWQENADMVFFIDSDLAQVSEKWVAAFVDYIRSGYDAVFSRRSPKWNGGDLTYHLAYPMMLKYWRSNIHEPISGDFAFSRTFMKEILASTWENCQLGYGVDFLFASVASKLNWCEIILSGKKLHKLRSFYIDTQGIITMRPKFEEVLLSIKKQACDDIFKNRNRQQENVKSATIGEVIWETSTVPLVDIEHEQLTQSVLKIYRKNALLFNAFHPSLSVYFADDPFIGIPFDIWSQCLETFILTKYDVLMYADIIEIIETIFFARVIGFFHDVKGKDNWYDLMEKQALKY